jgi:MoxR-like ATPase
MDSSHDIPPEARSQLGSQAGDVERVAELARAKQQVLEQLHRRIVGQERAIELLLVALFARGHGLLVGVPGLAKTSLVTSLAQTLSLSANRIQFTPDLMPSDITGTDVLEQDMATGTRHFRFIPGPIFTNILLADEINRTPPKTQAALLQAMEEQRVTASGTTHPIAAPYLVFATQNPIEQEGTYPLPEAQLDRFMLQIEMSYPAADEELEIVRRTTSPESEALRPVLSRDDILELQALVRRVPVATHVISHAVQLVRATRPSEPGAQERVKSYVSFGAGPRASQALILAAKARAVLSGRYAAEIDDVRALAQPILRHRLVLSFRAEAEGVRSADVIEGLLQSVPA